MSAALSTGPIPVPSHACGGCGTRISSALFACRSCWPRLPAGLRTQILRSWGRRQHGTEGAAAEHETAKAYASAWFARHPR